MKDPKAEALVSQFFRPKADVAHPDAKSVTIMKYLGDDDDYHFITLDRFNIPDDVERLDYMNFLKCKMLQSGEMKKHLWTKQTVLF